MIHENEIVMLILGLGILIFVLGNLSRLKRLPHAKLLMAAFSLMLVGWVLTVLEGFVWETLLNYLEHACYAAAAVLITLWSWETFRIAKEVR